MSHSFEDQSSYPNTTMAVNLVSSPLTPIENIPVPLNCCHTQVELLECNFTWTITNFTFLPQKSGEYLISSSFSSKTNDQSKWYIELYPRGTDQQCKNYISLFLCLESSSRNNITAKFNFTMLNAKKEKIRRQSFELHTFTAGSGWGTKKFITKEMLDGMKGVLPNDEVTICCKVSTVGDTSNYHQTIVFKVPRRTLSRDYGLLFENGKFCDVTLSVEGGKFHVHKIVLAARSPVFRAMFEHEMRERKENKVHIKDIDYEVLREMLEYIYTGKINKIQKMADGLLAAADKYALEELRVMCEAVLCKNLSIDNASKTLILSDLHSADQLKTHTINFINRYTLEVMETSGWKNMIQTHPHLVAEAYRASKFPSEGKKRKLDEIN